MDRRGKKRKNKVLVLLDWENLLYSLTPLLGDLSVFEILLRAIKKISREVGEIINIFVFTSPHLASVWGERFYEERFFVVSCPKITTKKGETKDTTDEILAEFVRQMIENLNFSHLCIGTGDRDLSKLYHEAMRKGLKTITIASSEGSLSSKLIPLSDQIILLANL